MRIGGASVATGLWLALGLSAGVGAQTAPSEALTAALPQVCAGAQRELALRCAALSPAGASAFSLAAAAQRLEELPGHARVGDLQGDDARTPAASPQSAWQLWASALHGSLDRREGRIEAGFDAARDGFAVGAGWQPSAAWVVDGGWQWAREDLDYRASDGRLRARLDGPVVAVAWMPSDAWRLEAHADRSAGRFESRRRVRYTLPGGEAIDSDAHARTRTERRGAGLALRRSDAFGSVSLDSGFGIDDSRTRIGAYLESGGAGWALAVPSRERRSRRAQLDVAISTALSRDTGVWLPSARLVAVREFDDASRTLTVRFVDDGGETPVRFATEEPDDHWLDAALGLVWVRPGGAAFFVEARQRIGHRFLRERQVALGLRLER